MTLVKTGPYFVYVASVARTTVIIPLRYIAQEAENRSHFILRKISRTKTGKVPIVLSIFIANPISAGRTQLSTPFEWWHLVSSFIFFRSWMRKNPLCPKGLSIWNRKITRSDEENDNYQSFCPRMLQLIIGKASL